MLECAAQHGFRFDAVQMPLNVMDAHCRSFERIVLPELVRRKIGVLGMKSMANGVILKSNTVTAIECLHYALNLPTSVVITGNKSGQACKLAISATAFPRKSILADITSSLFERSTSLFMAELNDVTSRPNFLANSVSDALLKVKTPHAASARASEILWPCPGETISSIVTP